MWIWKIICVDDDSPGDTLLQLRDVARVNGRFKVIELSRNFGKEAALTAGLGFATGAAVILIDADL